ncbi:hypothetical protein FH966_14780 [Lentibacillus cibarius]|uniref:Uncharacterized protein n=1 Tax=Lentibacillus cibarius TaxID=2583219 RepID=A0A549YLZ2_9BACI|nr:hypothetical protein [Lentibacillus cibarius]TRM08765.1 hypothetical protein FH966_16445 [Lentibacillus cibarius]TRM08793.1 hypothetical protein FH966_16595 [Lentibacillus cibarius]TRM12867.1 hypothetical protein FH966_14780 [Lentibacillus cibarius]
MDGEGSTTGIDWSGLSLPFDVGDLITSGNGLLGLVGSFVLLGLAFVFVPKIIGLIRNSFSAAKGK